MSDAHAARANVPPVPSGVRSASIPPPSRHELALMIWIAVFPTLTLLNVAVGPWLSDSGQILRTFVLATIAVPIVIYGLMPRLHQVRATILRRRAS